MGGADGTGEDPKENWEKPKEALAENVVASRDAILNPLRGNMLAIKVGVTPSALVTPQDMQLV